MSRTTRKPLRFPNSFPACFPLYDNSPANRPCRPLETVWFPNSLPFVSYFHAGNASKETSLKHGQFAHNHGHFFSASHRQTPWLLTLKLAPW